MAETVADEHVFLPTQISATHGEVGVEGGPQHHSVALVFHGVILSDIDQPLRLPLVVLTENEAITLQRDLDLAVREMRRERGNR